MEGSTTLILANIILVLCALIGMWCISNYNKTGFIVFFFVEVSMSYIGYCTKNYGLIIAGVLYLIMNIFSYIKWTKAEVELK